MKEPSNEAVLAVELWMARRDFKNAAITAYGTAKVACELCRLGRRFKALSVRLCNEPDPDERIGNARSRVSRNIAELCKPYHAQPDSSGSGIIVMLRTKRPGVGREQETALL